MQSYLDIINFQFRKKVFIYDFVNDSFSLSTQYGVNNIDSLYNYARNLKLIYTM